MIGEEEVDMDKMCMYEYFSNYKVDWDPETRHVRELKRRRNPAVIIPTPACQSSMDNEYWCYQMLMLFTPFRNHADVMVYPTYRDLTSVILIEYTDDGLSDPLATQATPDIGLDDTSALRLFDDDTSSGLVEPLSQPELPDQLSPVHTPYPTVSAEFSVTQLSPNLPQSTPPRSGDEAAEGISDLLGISSPPTTPCPDLLPLTQPSTSQPPLHPLTFPLGEEEEELFFGVPDCPSPPMTVCPIPSTAPPCTPRSSNTCTGCLGEEEEEVLSDVPDLPHAVDRSECSDAASVCCSDDDPQRAVIDHGPPTSDYPDQRRPFKSASMLLQLVFKYGHINKASRHCCDSLVMLEGFLKDAFADSLAMPTEAEVIMRLREMGYDDDNAICVDELLTKVALDFNMRQERKVVQEDHPEKRFFYGVQYVSVATDFITAVKKGPQTNAQSRTTDGGTASASTKADKLLALEEVRGYISESRGVYDSLKLRQKVVLLMILNTLEDMVRNEGEVNQFRNVRTCRLVLQGEAGTGKTYVLKEAVKLMCRFLDPNAVRVFAPTAQAAKTYQELPSGSSTFHKVFSKGYGSDNSNTGHVDDALTGTTLQTWAASMMGVSALICDEMSMISPLDINLMDRRLRDVSTRGESARQAAPGPFNDLPIVILCGDLYQLPPVKAWSLYLGVFDIRAEQETTKFKSLSAHGQVKMIEKYQCHNEGTAVYRSFFDKCILLNENVRQQGDQAWRYLLKRVRVGRGTAQDAQFLNTLVRDETELLHDRSPMAETWQTCKRFYPTVKMVMDEGSKMFLDAYPNLSERFDASPIITLNGRKAEHKDIVKYGTQVHRVGYPMHLASGAPVMVTKNIAGAREWGIVNGSTGTVVGYITKDGRCATYVLVQIDAVLDGMPPLTIIPPNGGSAPIVLRDTWPFAVCKMSVRRQSLECRQNGPLDEISISYFPLSLAYALTIHKAQGMTVTHAIVDIKSDGKGGIGCGQLPYVAFSRVTTSDGLWLRREVDLVNDVNRFAKSKDRDLLLREFERMEECQHLIMDEMGYEDEDNEVCARVKAEEEGCADRNRNWRG